MTVQRKLRFTRGDIVELPKRFGKNVQGTVAFSAFNSDGVERALVQRIVNGQSRQTVIREDELFRIGRVEVAS